MKISFCLCSREPLVPMDNQQASSDSISDVWMPRAEEVKACDCLIGWPHPSNQIVHVLALKINKKINTSTISFEFFFWKNNDLCRKRFYEDLHGRCTCENYIPLLPPFWFNDFECRPTWSQFDAWFVILGKQLWWDYGNQKMQSLHSLPLVHFLSERDWLIFSGDWWLEGDKYRFPDLTIIR